MTIPQPFVSLSHLIDMNASARPFDIAWSDARDEYTWRQFADDVNTNANTLADLGLVKGDIVAMLADSSYWTWHMAFGAIRAGGVVASLNTMLHPTVVASTLTKSGASLLVVSAKFFDLAEEALALLPVGERPRVVTATGDLPGSLDFEAARQTASAEPPAVVLEAHDGFTVVYSSGTTGVPKGILHTHAARLAMAASYASAFEFDPWTRLYLTTPPHTNGSWMVVLPAIYVAARAHVTDGFDVDQFLADVESYRPTFSFVVPTMGARLLKHPRVADVDWSCFQFILTSGAPMPVEMKRQLRELSGNALGEVWGFSEGVSSVLHPRDMGDRLDSVGRPMVGCEFRVIDDEGRELGRGQTGELVGRSNFMLSEYHHEQAATEALIWTSPEGGVYLRTGDLGQIDDDGWISVRGRKKDMIISGGLNIYPIDIEDVLRRQPAVEECAVVGVPHPDWGETPVAFVVPASGVVVQTQELREAANRELGRHQRISEIRLIDQLPRNTLGKVMKHQLVESS